MRRRIMTGALPVVLAIAGLLTLAMAGGAAAAPRHTAPPTPPEAPEPPATPTQAWLGVELQDVDAEMAKALDLRDGEGALVNRVVDDSPAAAAGLRDGDVIVSFDGQRVRDANELTSAVRDAKPGDRAPVVVIRDGGKKTIKVELGSRKTPAAVFAPHLEALHKGLADRMIHMHRGEDEGDGEPSPMMWTMGDETHAFLGVQMGALTEQLGRYFGAPDGEGVLVNEVVDDSPAARAGIEAGDVILRANDRAINGPDDVRNALRKADPGDKLSVTVLRDHAERLFDVTLGDPPRDRQPRLLRRGFREGGPGNVYIHKFSGSREDDTAIGDEEAGDGERKIIIRRFAPEAEQGGDTQALREELQELRAEVERLREEMSRKR
jgi:serine protease Do